MLSSSEGVQGNRWFDDIVEDSDSSLNFFTSL